MDGGFGNMRESWERRVLKLSTSSDVGSGGRVAGPLEAEI